MQAFWNWKPFLLVGASLIIWQAAMKRPWTYLPCAFSEIRRSSILRTESA